MDALVGESGADAVEVSAGDGSGVVVFDHEGGRARNEVGDRVGSIDGKTHPGRIVGTRLEEDGDRFIAQSVSERQRAHAGVVNLDADNGGTRQVEKIEQRGERRVFNDDSVSEAHNGSDQTVDRVLSAVHNCERFGRKRPLFSQDR
jgi:preprotein translocase subunit SecD